MNTISKWNMMLTLLLGAAVHAQVPSTNDTSDAYFNTGMGTDALHSLTPNGTNCSTSNGACNTASGYQALYSNATGSDNTAVGDSALYSNSAGIQNTASGSYALWLNTSGNYNTAAGKNALGSNTSGSNNTADGLNALLFNTSGGSNTAAGENALYGAPITETNPDGATGSSNTAVGTNALYSYSTGSSNTAVGDSALYSNTTGSSNIAVGYAAGTNLTTGSDNIEIGNSGGAADNKVIKIGTEGTQRKAFIAGIYSNTAVSGLAVVIGSNGELGAVSSSERFKTAIAPMGSNTEKLKQLRPVTFQYKADPQGTLRYGLIAEEVAKVYPELVVRNSNGRIDGVRYDELAPMLLNEVQKQAAEIGELKRQTAKVNELEHELTAMRAALAALQSNTQLVARR
jgi:hypothetical protein